jgi:hypothetical protein
MRRLGILILLLFLSAPALAQLSLVDVGDMGGVPVSHNCSGAYTGIGDVVSGAQAFYGLRAYSSTTCGLRLINIVRASDSHVCDVLSSTVNGTMDVTANCGQPADNGVSAATFCNATTCNVPTIYDATTTGNDAGAFSPSAEPVLAFNCINTTLPCLLFNGTSDVLGSAGCAVTTNPATMGTHGQRTTNVSALGIVFTGCQNGFNNWNGLAFGNGGNIVSCATSAIRGQVGGPLDFNWHDLVCAISGTTSANFVIDGTNNVVTVSATYAAGGDTTLGSDGAGGGFFGGKWTESFIYASNMTVVNMQALCHNESLYYGTPTC